jgi:predicted phosphodiesterase
MNGTASTKEFIYAISLVPSTVPIEFMVHEGKRTKFSAQLESLSADSFYTYQKNRARNWKVQSVEHTDRKEEVYCALVPETHSFTLANDILTGNCGHYPAQQFRIELDRRDQTKLVRRAIRDIIMAVAPEANKVTVTAVGGNHGENRGLAGKAFTTTGDNDDVAIFEQIAEIFQINPTAYGHVGFRLPLDKLSTSINLHGTIVAFTHGHLSKPSGNAAQAIWQWWEKQTMGRAHEGVADAHILITGHYHHLNIKEQQGRTVIIAPSITPIGEYFQDTQGVSTKAGTLTMLINETGWTDLTLL